jgi:hypothetical protein
MLTRATAKSPERPLEHRVGPGLLFSSAGATHQEVTRMIANARLHTASEATIYIFGQPRDSDGSTCLLAGQGGGSELTVRLAQQAGSDASQNVQ